MKKVILIFAVLISITAKAQQDPMISQYIFNGLFLNPAYSGSHEYYTSTLQHRQQWVNFSGAPKTVLLAVDGPLDTKSRNMGLGLIVAHDRIGATEQTDIYANYAYQLKLKQGKLAFGLKAGVSNYVFKSSNVTVWDENDEMFSGRRTAWLPKFGFGAYYFYDNWYAGLSIPTLLAYDARRDFNFDVNKGSFLNRHYYGYGGYIFKLDEDFKLKPSALIKYLPAAPVEGDINLNLLYKDQFWFGVGYRTMDAVVFMVEYQTKSRIRVGYSFDLTTTRIRKYSYGSHEIMIGYDFWKLKEKEPEKIKSVRFF
jgi:type IX secretion system PorP/SprF family membrane protein